jgi:hypothetical protein
MYEGVENPSAKLDGRAHKFGTTCLVRSKAVPAGPGVKQDAGLIDGDRIAAGTLDVQGAAAQDMEVTGSFCLMVAGDAAETAGVEDAGGKREVGEDGREEVHFDTLRYQIGIFSDQ